MLSLHWAAPLNGDQKTRPALQCVQENKAYYNLRLERANAKHVGVRAKRAAEAAAEDKDKAK